ncbi:hypothetical protein RHMOL_Rhmol01G0131700 [Rhododendron molle]|uniref:Uncharacterized protein n=1 Tax=Rhododendron molle TaxID=49168 RepID=A0ACC0Q2I1_RHOML|nr:hypothetical protein RHMOL_Rhmol01G0131700 [Rhododendron molle]
MARLNRTQLRRRGEEEEEEERVMTLYTFFNAALGVFRLYFFITATSQPTWHPRLELSRNPNFYQTQIDRINRMIRGSDVDCHEQLRNCLGALDGTYVPINPPAADKPRYRPRKGEIATNVLGVCTRDLKFVFVLSGWEGSATDPRILDNAIARPDGLRVPHDCSSRGWMVTSSPHLLVNMCFQEFSLSNSGTIGFSQVEVVDYLILDSLPYTTSSMEVGAKSSQQRGPAFSLEEDKILCNTWLEISQDPIKGVNQKKDKLWERITATFHALRSGNYIIARSAKSLQCRMTLISKAISKFRGGVRSIENLNPSDASEKDILEKAKEMFSQDVDEKKGFQHGHVWPILKEAEKWLDVANLQRQGYV